MPNFQRGAKAAKSSGAASFSRTTFFRLEDGEEQVVRFLTDSEAEEQPDGSAAGGWISIKQHQLVPTKGAPSDLKKGQSWPTSMSANCRKDPAWSDMGYQDCFICDSIVPNYPKAKAAKRTWALAVLREEVRGDDGTLKGYKDIQREIVEKGKDGNQDTVRVEPAIVVVNLGWKNFFSVLDTYASHFGTVLDQDFKIRRDGDSTDTTYGIIPLGQSRNPEGEVFDLRNPEFMKKYLPTATSVGSAQAAEEALVPVLTARTADEYYARFFDTRVAAPSSNTSQATETGVVPPPNNDATDEVGIDALRDRLKSYPEADAPADDDKVLVALD